MTVLKRWNTNGQYAYKEMLYLTNCYKNAKQGNIQDWEMAESTKCTTVLSTHRKVRHSSAHL